MFPSLSKGVMIPTLYSHSLTFKNDIMNIATVLQTHLHTEKQLTFADFMHIVLYHPQHGYYTSSTPKFGAEGDFVTAPEISPLFSRAVGNQCYQILPHLLNPSILEFGAGTGRLCVDLLLHLEQLDCLPQNYFILEVSGYLKSLQAYTIQKEIPHLYERIQWLSSWPAFPFSGVILANEVFDAMPVHRFLKTADGVAESYVVLNKEQQFQEVFKPCQDQALLNHLNTHLAFLPTPYQSEINLFIAPWLQSCSASLTQGAVLIIDYGFASHEYYHPDRDQGTLMCHYQHKAHTNPFINLGKQDITAHVDFTYIAEAALKAGWEVAGFTNQAAFLLNNGLLNLMPPIDNKTASYTAGQAIKILTHPDEMGELFKVMALTKQLDFPLNGFQCFDKRASL